MGGIHFCCNSTTEQTIGWIESVVDSLVLVICLRPKNTALSLTVLETGWIDGDVGLDWIGLDWIGVCSIQDTLAATKTGEGGPNRTIRLYDRNETKRASRFLVPNLG